ncbi:hypothetical protein FEM03_17720 [Phragmitibacter flavus]|uniref:FHA domain-containing protein n=1 Tax=Phragmitibacter flavus TaxID=2576071 RepID=A0A5R8KAY4_9BACT|nr:SpoIIE family protein phosphatase [Phragmitibacter flavus]TLD69478.1 hypothetical protein FEM03_17720 [Phragmitibacter flavus]
MSSSLNLEIDAQSWPLQSGDIIGRFGTVALDALKTCDVLSRHHLRVDLVQNLWHLTVLPNVRNATRLNGKLLTPEESVPLTAINDLTIHTLHLRLRQTFQESSPNTLTNHPVALLTIDPLLQIQLLNPSAQTLLGTTLTIGSNLASFIDPQSIIRLRLALDQLQNQQTTSIDLQSPPPRELHLRTLLRRDNATNTFLLALHDITDEHQQNLHLQTSLKAHTTHLHQLSALLSSPALHTGDLPVILPLIAQYTADLLPETHVALSILQSDQSLHPAAIAGTVYQHATPHFSKTHPGGEIQLTRPPHALWTDFDEQTAHLSFHLFSLALDNARRAQDLERLQLHEDSLKVEFAQATRYLSRLLPAPVTTGPVHLHWQYQPSGGLGGDVFGYDWLDHDHLYLFVVDVAGHGIGAALLAVSLINHLRLSIERKEPWLRDPADWLTHLNQTFPMEKHGGLTWTLWCGIYNTTKKELHYSSGGHPPAILLDRGQVKELTTNGPVLGALADITFQSAKTKVHPGAKLFLYTDGVFEFPLADGTTGTSASFVSTVAGTANMTSGECDFLHHHAAALCGSSEFPDDFTLLCAKFT